MQIKTMGITSRPFEFYVAFLVFFMGLYGIIDPNWPPVSAEPWEAMILIFEDVYLMIAGICIMASFIFRHKFLIESIVGEMFGWLFVGTAATVIVLTSPWVPPAIFVGPDAGHVSGVLYALWIVLWSGLAGASFMRYFDMRHWHKTGGNK